MKKLLRKLTAVVSAAAVALTCVSFGGTVGLTAAAETVGAFTVTGGTLNTDYTYENNVLTIKTATAITISGTTTDTIVVEAGVNANITLAGVNIDVSGTGDSENEVEGSAAFKIADNSEGNVTITLADGSVNTLTSGYMCAGLQKNGAYSETIGKLTIQGGANGTGKLTATGGWGGAGIGGNTSGSKIEISGGTVIAKGGSKGAGIGGGWKGSGSNITISGGTVTATCGYSGAGIGGGNGGSGSAITITGGVVTATGDMYGAGIGGGYEGSGSNINISGGSVKASGENAIGGESGNGAVTPTNGTSEVYLFEIANENGEEITIDGKTYPTSHDSEKKIYAYLTGTAHSVKVGEKTCLYVFDSESKTFYVAQLAISATNGGALTNGTDYKYENNVLTILKETPLAISGTTTTDRIEVASGVSANITLAGVNISSAGYPAFKIADDSTGNVTITLKDGTENTLKGGSYSAGLQKNGSAEGIGKLTIKGGTEGTGKLEATSSKKGGAGIGGSDNKPCSNIEICGGTVTATGGEGGAGIGGAGIESTGIGNGSNITISGGTVTANGGYWGAGIGGGRYKAGSNITISGGTVTANGGRYGAGIGGGEYGSSSDITISGGSVKASGANAIGGGYSSNGAVTPTLSDGTTPVYLLDKITNTDGADITINSTAYPTNHNGEEKIYAYLPAKTVEDPNVVKVGTKETKYVYDTKWLIVPTVTAPTAKTGLVYNGTAQELISAGETDFGTLLYSLDGTNYSEDIPTATNADSYTVYYKVQGNDDVSDVGAKTVSASIGKADPVGDKDREINVMRGVGTFTEPAFTSVDGQPLAGKISYDIHDTYEKMVEHLNTVDSGAVNEAYKFTPNDDTNYNTVSGQISFCFFDVAFKVGNDTATAANAVTVKANPTYGDTWADILKLNTGLKAVIVDRFGNVVLGTDVTTGFSLDVTGSPNAGSQTYKVLFNGTICGATYTDHVVASGTVNVAQKELTVSAGDYKVSKVYDGTTAAGAGSGNLVVSGLVGEDIVTITPTIGAYSSADVGTSNVTVTISLTGNANYKLKNTTVSVPAEITAKAITPTVEGSGTHTYTGSAITPNVTVKDGETVLEEDKDYTITVTNNINAGMATVTITAKSGGNYTFSERTRYFKIFKATPNVTDPTAKTGLVYNGTAQELITAGSTDFGTLVYSLTEDGEYSAAIPKGTIARTYTVYYKVLGNDNVDDTAAEQITATIGKVAVTVTAENYTVKQGTYLPELKYSATGLIGTDTLQSIGANVSIGYSDATPSAIGDYTIDVSGLTETTNYKLTYVDGTLTITDKKVQTITAADVTLTYGKTGKISARASGGGAITYTVKEGSDVIEVADDGTITTKKAGTAVVEVTAAANDDYAKAIKAVVVKVNKAAVTIKANSYTVKVGGDFPALDYTVTGLADGDSLGVSLGVSLELSCETDNTSTAGTYKITVKFNLTEDEKYIYKIQNGTLTVQRKSAGGAGGSSGGARPTTPTTNNPSIGGSSKSWSDVAADLGKLTSDSEATIELNGSTTVPVDVIKAIADTGSNVKLVINSAYAWVVDGADITAPAAADLTFVKTASTKSDGLRGVEGTQFRINNTNIPTNLEIAFKKQHAGKFANLYKNVDGKLTFVTCAKLGADGKVILPEVTEKGDYVSMLCEYSDRPGDMSNDGKLNVMDAVAVLKNVAGVEKGKNPLVADMNNDGRINVFDATAILKRIAGKA